MNSGFLADTEIVAERDTSFSDIEVISQSSTHFIARCTRYGRRWILKGLRPEVAGDELMRQQLFKEYTILSMLSHPGIVSFAGMEEVDSLGLCIVMECIEGVTLDDALRSGALSRDDRRRLLLEIAEAVAYLHSCGVVHRDLKPANIMVRRNGGAAVIIDFGLADTDAFTIVKYPAGTLGFASERQQHAFTPDTSDDVYSLGVIMRMLYPEYASVARRCVAPTGRRYRDGSQLVQALRRRRRLGRRVALTIMAVLVAAVVAVLVYHNMQLSSSVSNLDGQLAGLRQDNERQIVDSRRQQSELNDSRQQQTRLADTVSLLRNQLARETAFRTGIERHKAYVDSLERLLNKRYQTAYARYLKDSQKPGYTEKFKYQKLVEEMMKLRDDILSRQNDLTDAERNKLASTVNEFYHTKILRDY